MKFNETKAILKLAENTQDEDLKAFLVKHYLSDEEQEEQKEEKQEAKKEEAQETKEEKKEEKETSKEDEILKTLGILAKEIKDIKEKQPKLKSFGAQPKVGEGKESSDFDSIFANLTKTQS